MSFDGCWSKVVRAREHRNALETMLTETFRGRDNLARVGLRYDPQSGDHIAHVTFVPDLSSFFLTAGLLIGDTVHNLRSALDHVAFACAMQHTKGQIKTPRAVEWPITESPEKWKSAKERNLREVSPAHRAIIQRHQHHVRLSTLPAGSLDGFLLLSELDNTDKHRILLPVLHPTAGISDAAPSLVAIFMMQAFTQLGDPEPWHYRRVELGAEVARYRLPFSLAPMEMAGYVAPFVCLDKPFPEIPILELIDQLIGLVVRTISEFAPIPDGV